MARRSRKKKKRGFIRALWGIHSRDNPILAHRYGIDRDINNVARCKYNQPFRTYVMGQDNVDNLKKAGFDDCVLIDDRPFSFDVNQHRYRNKMEAIKYAMEEDGYDEIVYLDWDCLPTAPLPLDFWSELGKRDVIQANLMQYKSFPRATWRNASNILFTDGKRLSRRRLKIQQNVILNGGFLYIRDKTIPSQAVKWWQIILDEGGKGDNDEPAWQRLLDEMTGGWVGAEAFWERFEAMHCVLGRRSVYPSEKLLTKTPCFKHNI